MYGSRYFPPVRPHTYTEEELDEIVSGFIGVSADRPDPAPEPGEGVYVPGTMKYDLCDCCDPRDDR